MEQDLLDAAGRAVSARLTPVGGIERGNVVRAAVDGGRATVIVKAAKARPPDETFWNEWAGLTFLTDLPGGPPGTPRFVAGDLEAGVIVMEDLGPGDSLAHVLLRQEREAADAALDGWIDAIAGVHVATAGRAEAYRAHRSTFGPGGLGLFERPMPTTIKAIGKLTGVTDGPLDVASQIDIELADPEFAVVRLNDVCPDNNRVGLDGRVRLFDMEWANASHALLDVGYVHTTMASCWCLRQLPGEVKDRLVARYRSAVVDALPVVATLRFELHLALARMALAIDFCAFQLGAEAQHGDGIDRYWDTYDFMQLGRRQVVLLRLAQVVEAAADAPMWTPPLVEWAERVADALRARWGDVPDVPLYPAYGGPSASSPLT